jgi:hypothetical protein
MTSVVSSTLVRPQSSQTVPVTSPPPKSESRSTSAELPQKSILPNTPALPNIKMLPDIKIIPQRGVIDEGLSSEEISKVRGKQKKLKKYGVFDKPTAVVTPTPPSSSSSGGGSRIGGGGGIYTGMSSVASLGPMVGSTFTSPPSSRSSSPVRGTVTVKKVATPTKGGTWMTIGKGGKTTPIKPNLTSPNPYSALETETETTTLSPPSESDEKNDDVEIPELESESSVGTPSKLQSFITSAISDIYGTQVSGGNQRTFLLAGPDNIVRQGALVTMKHYIANELNNSKWSKSLNKNAGDYETIDMIGSEEGYTLYRWDTAYNNLFNQRFEIRSLSMPKSQTETKSTRVTRGTVSRGRGSRGTVSRGRGSRGTVSRGKGSRGRR